MKRGNVNINQGNGAIVSNSSNVKLFINNSDTQQVDYEGISNELEILLKEYMLQEKDDSFGIKAIREAAQYAKEKDESGLKKIVKKFSGYIIDLARDLSLKLLVHYITQ